MLEKLINNLKQLRQHLENKLDSQVNTNLANFAEMQRDRLNEGKNKEGENLKRNEEFYPYSSEGKNKEGENLKRNEGFYPYSSTYKKYKKARGGQVNFVDLKLDGNFHAGITATKVGRGKITLYSKDKKDKFLPNQYEGIYGFSPNQENELNDLFKSPLIKAVKEKITNKK